MAVYVRRARRLGVAGSDGTSPSTGVAGLVAVACVRLCLHFSWSRNPARLVYAAEPGPVRHHVAGTRRQSLDAVLGWCGRNGSGRPASLQRGRAAVAAEFHGPLL